MKKAKFNELVLDNSNFNLGNEYGNSLIEKSISKNGLGRGILIDKNNRIIAGNKTFENAGALGFEDVIIVETTGNELVVTKRVDIDLDSKQGRELALSDNATSKANLTWDIGNLELEFTNIELEEWGVKAEKPKEQKPPQINIVFEELEQLQAYESELIEVIERLNLKAKYKIKV